MALLLTSLSTIFWLAVALSILVFVHEMGHFLTARLFGMRVDMFSIGFGQALVKKQIGQTEYRVGWLPLGGYVKIAGMVDESMDVPYLLEPKLDAAGNPILDAKGEPVMVQTLDATGKPIPTESEPQPDEFRAKPVWQRMIVISAGVVFNLILTLAIYTGLTMTYGRAYTPAENVRLDVRPNTIAAEMGLRSGDRVVAVNGEAVEDFEDVFTPATLGADTLKLTVDRNGQAVSVVGPDQLMTRFARAQRAATAAGAEVSFGSLFGAEPALPPVLASVSTGSAAEAAGLRAGDRITAIDGQAVPSWSRLTEAVSGSSGRALRVRWTSADTTALVNGAGEPVPLVATAGGVKTYETLIAPRQSGDRYILGVLPDDTGLGVRYERFGLGESISAGYDQTVAATSAYVGFFGKLFTGRESVRENVGGPIMIAQESRKAAGRGGASFWNFVAGLSIALAVFNILPIPALDGGHLVFLVYEAVARREPSLKVRMVVQQIGLVLILALMAFAVFNDVSRWIG